MTLEEILKANPDLNLLSRTKLTARLKKDGVSKEEIDTHFKPKELNQIFAPPKQPQPLKITAPPFTFQIDIAFLPDFKSENKQVYQFLCLVDIISRKAYCYPMKTGTMADVTKVFEEFYLHLVQDESVIIAGVQADNGFNNKTFQSKCDELNIQLVTQVAKDDHIVRGHGDKLGIVDRFVRTIKLYIQKYMLVHHDLRWTVWLSKLVAIYNDTPHEGVDGVDDDTTPNEMFADPHTGESVYMRQKAHNRRVGDKFDISVGDVVRVLMPKAVFAKEKARYSTDLYVVKAQIGYRFRLQDEAHKGVDRLYRPSELLKVKGQVQDRLKASAIAPAVAKHKSVLGVQRGLVDKTYEEAAAELAAVKPVHKTRSVAVKAARPVRVRKAREKLNI